MHVQKMIATHPDVQGNVAARLVHCIEECYDCAEACVVCADACLAEPDVQQLRQCIRFNLDCADVCGTAGALASRRTGSNIEVVRAMLGTCADACRVCAEECERHAQQHQHCKVCAEACRSCERACREAMQEVH